MHSRAAVLATMALVATGLPFTLAAPVGTADSVLEIREPSDMSFGVYQTRDDVQTIPQALAFSREPLKTKNPSLSFSLSSDDKTSLLQFLTAHTEGSSINIKGATFKIQNGQVLFNSDAYDISAVLPLTNPSKRDVHILRDVDREGLGTLEVRKAMLHARAPPPKKPPGGSKPRPIKSTRPDIKVSLDSTDQSNLAAFLQASLEGKSITIKGITFTFRQGYIEISTDTNQRYTIDAVKQLIGRAMRSRRGLGSERRSTGESSALQARAKKPPTGKTVKNAKPSLTISLNSEDKAELRTFLTNAVENSTITIGGVTFTIQDGKVAISTEQGVLYEITAATQLTQ